LYEKLKECWLEDWKKRPTYQDIADTMKACIAKIANGSKVTAQYSEDIVSEPHLYATD
jgi:hypothetical protein